MALLALLAGLLNAQDIRLPTIDPGGIVNAASFLPPTLPGGAIAQGSIFSIFGENLGPKGLEARELPLEIELGGVRMEVELSDSRLFNALPVFVGANQINAVLPSDVPVGEHQMRVIRDGLRSPPRSFKVVRRSPGLFIQPRDRLSRFAPAQVQLSWGTLLLSRERPARPGEIVTLWATGLGPVAADQPTAQALAAEVEVWIGGRQAEVLYQGRSPCCVGLDQLNVRVPEDLQGCHVSVRAVGGGVTSNDATIAVAQAGPCAAAEPRPARVMLNRFVTGETTDHAGALFGVTVAQLDPSELPPVGSCLSHVPFGSVVGGSFPDPPGGPENVRIAGPLRELTLERSRFYERSSPPDEPFIAAGFFSLEASGGQFPPFSASLQAPVAVGWLSDPELVRETGMRIRWTGGTGEEDVVIWTRPGTNFIDLVCRARASDGEFVIPASALANLAPGPRTVSLGNFVATPLEFQTDGPESGLFIVNQETWAQIEADPPRLPSTPITMPDGEIVHAELATSFGEQQRGLMFRTILEPDRGMLFLYTRPGVYFFWMFRTLIPLDIIWLDSDRRIIFINRDTPPCPEPLGRGCPSYGPSARSQFILELGAGEAARRGLEVGDRLEW